MIDTLCVKLTNLIRQNVPDVDDEKAEIINYGLQNIIGELPKIIPVIVVSCVLGIFKLTMIAVASILAYRMFSGGFHLNTHIGCLICSLLFSCGTVYVSKIFIVDSQLITYAIYFAIWIFNLIVIKLYAPADTENVPIISKKQRRKQQIESYIIMTLLIIIATFCIDDIVISNILVYGTLFQSIGMTRIVYKITKNKYGHEVYEG